MAVVRFATPVANAVLATVKSAIDAGAAGGTIKIYNGTMPADADTAVGTQVLLGTLTFSTECGTVSAKSLTMASITQDSSADATGTATWARIADSDGATVMDIDCSVTGGTGALQLNTTNIVKNGPILVTSFVVSVA